MTEFTAFVQRPEKVDAFQFQGPHQIEQVLDAFGADHDHWTLYREGTDKYRLSFADPSKVSTGVVSTIPLGGMGYMDPHGRWVVDSGHLTVSSGSRAVVSGSWVVKRYVDTDHSEVAILDDKAFRQKYQLSIEAGYSA